MNVRALLIARRLHAKNAIIRLNVPFCTFCTFVWSETILKHQPAIKECLATLATPD